MTDEPDTDRPATEQFDLTYGMDYATDAEEIHQLASELESAEDFNPDDAPTERLAEYVAALKRLEDAAEDARNDVFEDALDHRTEDGESVGPLTKATGSSSYVTDAEGAFAAVADAGADPLDVASVKIGDLRDVLGADADEFVGQTSYTYFRRDA